MKSETYPLAVPPDLLIEVRRTAKETGLSLAEAMRQSLKLGLPKLREHSVVDGRKKRKKTKKESRLDKSLAEVAVSGCDACSGGC